MFSVTMMLYSGVKMTLTLTRSLATECLNPQVLFWVSFCFYTYTKHTMTWPVYATWVYKYMWIYRIIWSCGEMYHMPAFALVSYMAEQNENSNQSDTN